MIETKDGFELIKFLHEMPTSAGILFDSFRKDEKRGEGLFTFKYFSNAAKSVKDFSFFMIAVRLRDKKIVWLDKDRAGVIVIKRQDLSPQITLCPADEKAKSFKITRSFKKLFISSCTELLELHHFKQKLQQK